MTKVAIGIDIGGTSTKIGAVGENGKMHFQSRLTTHRYGDFGSFVKVIAKAIRHKINTDIPDLEMIGAGVGAPQGVRRRGTIEHSSNLPWKGILPLQKALEDLLEVKVMVTNDANAAAIGEKRFGAAKAMNDFVMITLGTGLGSAFFSNGMLVEGFDSLAGELGHAAYDHVQGRYCQCGRRGCLETYVSATGIKRTVYQLLADHYGPSDLRRVSFDELSTKMITESARRGDPLALEAFEHTGHILGSKLAEVVHYCNPEAIFLFGGLSQSGEFIFTPVKKHLEAHLLPSFRNKVSLLPSLLEGSAAAILGASGMIWNALEKAPA